MYFVPEGQHDSSQARSAWSHEENTPVPAGRLNGSRFRLDANSKNGSGMSSVSTTNISGTDNDFDRPSGSLCIAIQALRAWLLSACPSGTKAIHALKSLALS